MIKSRLHAIAAGLAIVAAATACKDPNANTTVSPVAADTLTVWALTGTSPSFPSAYLAALGAVTRADGTFNFDIAFDIDAAGRIVVYPQRLVGVPLNGPKPVGLQRITGTFESLERAPSSGYVFDSTFTVAPGQGLVMQVQASNECLAYFSSVRYTKLVVDSINKNQRTLYFRTVHDPNCGYRNLIPGATPKN
ncbi:MAG TPA: hypothetical protein VM076_01860 [Gemmatimonadaceae bacterium]|nr:hypothetical protein [Gemmatimonadaceae bacterium]